MSFPFRDRDRPSLRDRLRGFGKSGDEIMEQLKQSLDEDRKNFFESNSKFGRSPGGFSSSRGFPFDDDVMHGKSKLKDHLDDLVKRHPELADQLKDWGDIERSPKIPRGAGLSRQQNTNQEQPQDQRNQPPNTGEGGGCSSQGPSKPQNLRNTVPDMQAQQEKMDHQRNQRSQSAPPEGPPVKGQVPQNENTAQPPPNNDVNNQQQQQQPNSGQQPQQQNQGAQSQVRGNERYIPIFVEGRGETIVNVPVQKEGGAQPTQTPPPRQKKSFKAPPPPGAAATQQSPPPPPAPSPAPSSSSSQETIPPPQQAPPQTATPPPPAQPPRPPSPLTLVASIQKEVDELKQRVDAFKGSKTDKEYIYLDEMLTRNLLKLDNIDSEGRDEVRMARKEVIKLIQQCINVLESCQNSNNP